MALLLKVIKLEYILKLRIKRNDWLLADTCRVCKQQIIALYFELENELKFYNFEAMCWSAVCGCGIPDNTHFLEFFDLKSIVLALVFSHFVLFCIYIYFMSPS